MKTLVSFTLQGEEFFAEMSEISSITEATAGMHWSLENREWIEWQDDAARRLFCVDLAEQLGLGRASRSAGTRAVLVRTGDDIVAFLVDGIRELAIIPEGDFLELSSPMGVSAETAVGRPQTAGKGRPRFLALGSLAAAAVAGLSDNTEQDSHTRTVTHISFPPSPQP